MKYTGGEGDFPKYNNTNIGFKICLRFSVCKQTTKPALKAYNNTLSFQYNNYIRIYNKHITNLHITQSVSN